MIGFKDQSLKMLKLADMLSIIEQPRKKVKKGFESKKSGNNQDIME